MITLRKMTEEEFAAWREATEAAYGAEHVRAGNWSEKEAPEKSREALDGYLPNGLETEHHHVCRLVATGTGQPVGHLWYAVVTGGDAPALFIFSLGIDDPYRRQGYATAALQLLEQEAQRLGARSLRLHVFGDNAAARSLYTRLGYRETNVQMSKRVAA